MERKIRIFKSFEEQEGPSSPANEKYFCQRKIPEIIFNATDEPPVSPCFRPKRKITIRNGHS